MEEQLTQEESSRYMEIVKKGNIDEMFNFGRNFGRKTLLSFLISEIEAKKLPTDSLKGLSNIALGINEGLTEAQKIIKSKQQ